MSLLFRGTVKLQRPGTWYPRAWLSSGDSIYLVEENEENALTIHELNCETLKWSRFALNMDGENVYEFGETCQHLYIRLISNEFLLLYTVDWEVHTHPSRLFKIDINTGEFKKWRFHDHPLDGKDAVIINQCLYAFQQVNFVPRSEFTAYDLTMDNAQWTPPIGIEVPLDMVDTYNVILSHLSYGGDVYWLYAQLIEEDVPEERPHRIEKFNLYKFSTSTRQMTKVSEELETPLMLDYLFFNTSFVVGDELSFVFSEHVRGFSWMCTYNVPSKKWKKHDIPHVGVTSACCVDSQLLTYKLIVAHKTEEDKNEINIIALSPSLEELCEAVIVKYELDTSKMPPIVQERLQRYTNVLGD